MGFLPLIGFCLVIAACVYKAQEWVQSAKHKNLRNTRQAMVVHLGMLVATTSLYFWVRYHTTEAEVGQLIQFMPMLPLLVLAGCAVTVKRLWALRHHV